MKKKESRNRRPFGNRHQKFPRPREKLFSAFLSEAKTFFEEVHFSVDGNRELFIEGACSVAEYDDGFIRIITRRGELLVTGSDLSILGYGPTVMTVVGKIGGITWS